MSQTTGATKDVIARLFDAHLRIEVHTFPYHMWKWWHLACDMMLPPNWNSNKSITGILQVDVDLPNMIGLEAVNLFCDYMQLDILMWPQQ